jgi:hypothetical protein
LRNILRNVTLKPFANVLKVSATSRRPDAML